MPMRAGTAMSHSLRYEVSREYLAGRHKARRAPVGPVLGVGIRSWQEMIPRAQFGSTGHQSTRTLFGAAALSKASHTEAERALELLLDHGVNHIDTAASYGDAELRIAPWLKQRPDTFFLASKTGKRDYAGAKEEIHRSLERLGVDRIDLIQLHNLVDVIEWETALREGGALEAAVEARSEGLVRFIGVTGHGLSVPAMHRRSLERFP